ncbi:two component transcriptional regulator, LytTR family [Emticicia oligotrophica DSM 17448]|uniref:Two component transcriptional regulator, LytTR family n=1 Tax=Emticicia oligotrophica (strain DSM 17448 / CIP 109782 / MTCC 6937 / GPTSA100-15) TaxID=929562 RepID=A0ABM5N540_EMTOG|nr:MULTISPECIES: LytTR family DNA-binding domain-containing protein [Emticicia]AFK04616.1 two component transcriptional regulator, LytTR family [Emticicia oligotrophica DSM 17448]
MKINTLVVDDNPDWQTILSKFVQMNPNLELVGVCSSAMEAYGKMAEVEVDLLICDIEMPDMTGLALVKSIRIPPLVIFVTAHPNYALDCYEVSPIDFLLKPIDLERFIRSIERVKVRMIHPPESANAEPYFFIRENLNYVQIEYREVLYMKSQENFLQIVTTSKSFLPILSIAKMEEQLKGDRFLRVHRSYIVNRSAINLITKSELILVDGTIIPIGEQYRMQVTRKHIEGKLISRTN